MPQNLRQLSSGLPADLRLPESATQQDLARAYNRLIEALNHRFSDYDQQHAAHAGHQGPVKLMADLDLNGHKIINAGRAEQGTDLITKEQSEATAGAMSTLFQLAVSGDDTGLDIGDMGGGEDVVETEIPSAVRNIEFYWHNGKTGWWLHFKRPKDNHATIKGYDIAMFNGSDWMDLEDGSVAVDEADATRRIFNTEYKAKLNVANLESPFSSTGVDVKITPISLIRGAYIRGTPATYGSLVAPGDDFVNADDAVNTVTAGITAGSPTNMIRNGDFKRYKDAGNPNVVKRWGIWNGAATPVAASSTDLSTTSSGWVWNKTSHSITCSDVTNSIVNPVEQQLEAGGVYYIRFWAKSSATPTQVSIYVYLHRNSDATNNIDNIDNPALTYVPIPLTGLNTSYQLYGGIIKIKDSPAFDDGAGGYASQNMSLQVIAALGLGGATITIDKIQLGAGTVGFNFSPYEDEAEVSNVVPSTAIVPPDLSSSTDGQRGGWFTRSGEGGPVELYT